MADNVAITPGSGTNIATDDIGGVQYQRVKATFGADGVATDVSTTNPMPVGGGFVSTANSSAVVLAAAGVFTGTSEDISQYSSVTVSVFASHVSATDGLSMQQSSNGTNWDNLDVYTIPANTGKAFRVQVTNRFFRVVYTNGATLQTSFRLQTIFHGIASPGSSVRPQDARPNDNDMQEVLAYQMAYNPSTTTWDRVRGDTTNGMYIQVRSDATATAATSTLASVTGAVASTTIRVANTARKGLTVYNESTAILYLAFAATASVTAYTVQVPPSGYYELPQPVYTGLVTGIWSAVNGSARVTELT